MLKRKVPAIWILILAVITASACVFATVVYIRCGKRAPDTKVREIGQFRFLKAESDSTGVSFEVINVRKVGSDFVLDLRWINNSGDSVVYGKAYEMYRLKDGEWGKIETELSFPDISYCINSGSVGGISYTIPGRVDLIAGEKYRLQTEFQFQYGNEYSKPLKNRLDFEIVKAAEYIMKEAYIYRPEHDLATLYLDPDNNTFSLSLSVLSSYWPHGRYTETNGYVICKTDDETGNTYTFRRGKGTLIFAAGRSSDIPLLQYKRTDENTDGFVPDGAVFRQEPLRFGTDVPSLWIKLKADAEIENDEFPAALCSCDWTVSASEASGQMINTNACGPGIGAEDNLPEVSVFTSKKALLQFNMQPDNVTVKCLEQGGGVEDICNIDRSGENFSFELKKGEYIYRVIAEYHNGNHAEYGFVGRYLISD